ncbi:MAG: multiheme c-type cytochrome [Planctomycetota bacterium]
MTVPMDYLGRTKRGRDVTTCIGCHSTTGQVHGTRVDDLRAGVGCESCHGPGRRHVAAVEAGLEQLSIEFAKGHRTADEELHLCGRCHRSTEALRVIPDPDEPKLARFQPVGLSQSACYQRSEGVLRCSTCHDPHQSVEQAAGTFNAHCQSCHGGASSKQPFCSVQPAGDCTSCHMPAVEVHPGIRFHDHWIRRRKDHD